ncbi:MAG: ParB N-terminal domain-containing protein [Anaerolineae bacterium]|nr:ParB N-terminal domain-containing protein [Anaerolineae bacterium]
MPTAAIKLLKAHPAQMRTVYDLESLATLTLQLSERGLDDWQPIVAAPHGDAYYLVSGHRRHMAQLLAFALRDWEKEHPDTEITIEVVRTMLNTLVDSLGSLEGVIASLLTKYGDEEISFVTFEGSQKAQILALHAANYGSEKPDALGVAHSFRQAVEVGATPEEIARNVGQHVQFVRNHLALTEIPPELAQRIAAGDLPMSVATAVADVPEPKRTGLSIFILANEVGKLTAKAIKDCALTLKKWPGLQLPLMVKHQSQRNIARALVALWGQVVDAYPEDAYAAAAMLIYRNVHDEPWSNQEKLTLWFQALGGDTYFTDGRINWTAVVEYLITDVACDTCPIGQLPRQPLRSDLSQGQDGPLGMPCRVGQEANSCIHGLAPNDSFDVRVPWEWSEHPGVVGEGGDYRSKSYEDLRAAWQEQAAKEQAEVEAAVATHDEESETAPATSTVPHGQTTAQVHNQKPDKATTPDTPAKDLPIVKQRAQIADFMKRHEQRTAHHPFATPCGRCRHRLDSSPTKDESVPHCAWAGRLRNISFKLLVVDNQQSDASRLTVPVCRQYAPSQPWAALIPAHPEPPGVPRDWLKAQIRHLVNAGNRHHNDRNTFEFLTGRPMTANENYGDWFSQQLESQGGELSDAQLFTLFVWAHTEWQRAQNRTFSLPINGHGKQFIAVQERPWRVGE